MNIRLSFGHLPASMAVAALLLCSGAAAGCRQEPGQSGRAAEAPRKPVSYTVSMDATAFDPPALTLAPGDTVVWVNKDPFPHTATAPQGAFSSGSIAPGASWSYVAGKKGDFAYACTFHPLMKGTLHVQ